MKQKGLTILEILLVIGILAIVSTVIISSSHSSVSKYTLEETVENVVSVLEKARLRASNSYNDSEWSVRIESSRVIMYEGAIYSAGNSSNVATNYNSGIQMDTLSLQGGGSSVTFDKVTGATSNYGTAHFQISSTPVSSSTIAIDQTGLIHIR